MYCDTLWCIVLDCCIFSIFFTYCIREIFGNDIAFFFSSLHLTEGDLKFLIKCHISGCIIASFWHYFIICILNFKLELFIFQVSLWQDFLCSEFYFGFSISISIIELCLVTVFTIFLIKNSCCKLLIIDPLYMNCNIIYTTVFLISLISSSCKIILR